MATEFTPSVYSKLKRRLQDLVNSNVRSNEWYVDVERIRSTLVDLGRVKGMNDQDRKEVEGGTLTVHGERSSIGTDYIQQSLLLAKSLRISEHYAATLLADGLHNRSRLGRSAVDASCIVYHKERQDLLACIKFLVYNSIELRHNQSDAKKRDLGNKMATLLDAMLEMEMEVGQGASKKKAKMVDRILEEIGLLKEKSDQVQAELRGAALAQPPPQQQFGGALQQQQNQQNQPARLGDEIQLLRLQFIHQERRELGTILYLLAFGRMLPASGITSIVKWSSSVKAENGSDALVTYVLVALLAALDPTPDAQLVSSSSRSSTRSDLSRLFEDRTFVSQLNVEITTKAWTIPALKSTVVLQWTLFLSEALRCNPGLGTELRLSQQGIQNLVLESIAGGGSGANVLKGDALVYLNLNVLAFRNKAFDSYDAEDDDLGEGDLISSTQDQTSPEQEIDPEFQAYILAQVQNLVVELTSTMLPFIRKLQRAEEDASFAASRGRVGSGSRGAAGAAASRDRRYDIEALFDLVTLLCRGRPDAGVHFWMTPDEKGTSRFLKWAIDVRENGHQRALLAMLAALATGDSSAWHAHSLLSEEHDDGRLVSWRNLFGWMQYYIDSLRPAGTSSSAFATISSSRSLAAGNGTVGMPPEEIDLLRSFLRLLKNVVYYSTAARSALYANVEYSAVNRLFGLYSVYAPVELKAALLEALAAFAHPTASQDAAERAETAKIVSNLWSMLESSQALGAPAASHGKGFGAPSSQASGVYSELESIEAPNRSFPGSTAFIKLLTSLVLVPPRANNTSTLLNSSTVFGSNSMSGGANLGLVLNLGQAHRAPGVEPYVNFVIDGILLQAGQREYANQAERWKVTSSCLEFLERCLTSYDLSALLSMGSNGSPEASELASLLLHPGFNVMRRLLTGSKLLNEVLGVLAPGASNPSVTEATFDLVDSDRANTVFFKTSVKHALRIVQRVLRIQDIYLQVLLPYLSEAANAGIQMPVDVRSKVGSVGGYSSLDSHLLHQWQAVVQIALFVNCEQDDIALLSVRVLGLIAKSSSFSGEERFEHARHKKMNRLLGLLDMSDEADRVKAGFVAKLERGGMSDEASVEAAVQRLAALVGEEDNVYGEGSELASDEVDGLASAPGNATEALRLVILNFLIANTASSLSAPNIAHLILGYDLRTTRPEEQTLPTPSAEDGDENAFHSIMDLLAIDPDDDETPTLVESSPALAEKCFSLIQNLCIHPFTSVATLRYLRTGTDFFTDQLCALPLLPIERSFEESSGSNAFGKLVLPGGRSVETSVDAVIASLRSRALILDGVALELHSLINGGMASRAKQLISVLCGSGALDGTIEGSEAARIIPDTEDFNNEPFSNGTMRLLEALTSLDFEWQDGRDLLVSELHLLANLDVNEARRPESDTSIRVFDINALLHIITHARYNLHKNGQLSTDVKRANFQREAEIVLNLASAQNSHRAISQARKAALESWRHILDMVLARSVHLIRPESRATTLSDILQILLPRLVTQGPDLALSDLYSGAVLSLLTALRQCRASIGGEAQIGSLEALSTDKLVGTLRQLIDAILLNGISGSTRGNLYSALINFLQLVGAGSQVQDDSDETASVSTYAGTSGGTATILESRTASLLLSQADRLVPLVAKDALDGMDVWRTVAFTLLDKLCALEIGASSRHNPVRSLELLSRPGFLQSFVASLRDMDLALQDVVRPDPSSLNSLYIYESMFAFFNRLTQSRAGAERLLDSRIFDVLSEADYLASRPDQEHDFIDLDSFLPAATERYNALLTPALQLCVGILSSVSSKGSTSRKAINDFSPSSNAAPRQAQALLSAHRDTLLQVLKSAAAETTSIEAVEQARLLVSILSFVLPTLDDDALSPPSAFSAFHSATLSLAAAFLHPSAWQARVVPHTENEREADALAAPWSNGASRAAEEMETDTQETRFDVRAAKAVSRLDAALLRYLESSSETHAHASSSSKIRPVLTPTISVLAPRSHTPFEEEGGRRSVAPSRSYSSPIPSLGAALASLDHNIVNVLNEMQSLEGVEAMLAKPDAVRMDEWDEVARDAPGAEDDMGPAQRKRLALGELRRRRAESRINMVIRLDAIEILLVLLFRHFNYYLSLSSRIASSSSNYDMTSNDAFLRGSRQRGLEALGNGRSMNLTTGEAASLGREAVEVVNGALDRLQQLIDAIESGNSGLASINNGTVSSSAATLVPHSSERVAFVEMAARKLQETMSLVDDGNGRFD